jgi:hypothetical protein
MARVVEEDSYWDQRSRVPQWLRDTTATGPAGCVYELEDFLDRATLWPA